MGSPLPPIPPRRYFTIGEVAELCDVKPHVLRSWERAFPQLRPAKRQGNRRYYQHHEVLLVRRIRELLYEQGYTVRGARNLLRLSPGKPMSADTLPLVINVSAQSLYAGNVLPARASVVDVVMPAPASVPAVEAAPAAEAPCAPSLPVGLREKLLEIRQLLGDD